MIRGEPAVQNDSLLEGVDIDFDRSFMLGGTTSHLNTNRGEKIDTKNNRNMGRTTGGTMKWTKSSKPNAVDFEAATSRNGLADSVHSQKCGQTRSQAQPPSDLNTPGNLHGLSTYLDGPINESAADHSDVRVILENDLTTHAVFVRSHFARSKQLEAEV